MPANRNIDWPAAAVAVAIVGLLGAISIAAIIKYGTVEDALKWWTGLSAIAGILTGAATTFFFTRGEVNTTREQLNQAQTQATEERNRTTEERNRTTEERNRANRERDLAEVKGLALSAMASKLLPDMVDNLRRENSAVNRALGG